jgi:hypothetical protein
MSDEVEKVAEDPKDSGRYAIRVTNHDTGEIWSIHDTKAICLSEQQKKLKEWDTENVTVEGPVEITEE